MAWKNFVNEKLKIFEINTTNLSKLTDNNYSNLIKSIHNILENFFKIEVEAYKSNPEMRLDSK